MTIPTSDIYRPYQLLLNKKACWMTIFILITAVVVTAVASHTHYHFKPPFKELDKPIVSPGRTLTWKELLAYGTLVRLTVRSQPVRSEKTGQLYFLDWTLPPVLAKRLHISNHLGLVSITHYILKIPPWSKQSPTLVATLLWKLRSVPSPLKSPMKFHECFPIPYTPTLLFIPCAHPISFFFFFLHAYM